MKVLLHYISKHFLHLAYMVFILAFATSCVSRASKAVVPASIPGDIANTTLLVEKFEYEDPIIRDSFYDINTDSLYSKTKFKFATEDEMFKNDLAPVDVSSMTAKEKRKYEREERRKKRESNVQEVIKEKKNPLIEETNKNLDNYNKNLEKAMKSYNFRYSIAGKNEIDSSEKYSNLNEYRYVLKRKPVLHCYIDPRGETFLSHRYMHYIHDRQTNTDLADIQVFAKKPYKSVKAIAQGANRIARR